MTRAGDVEGPHQLPQPDQHRAVARGKNWSAVGECLTGGAATLLAIFDGRRSAWVFYFETDPDRAIAIGLDEVERLRRKLGAADG